MMTPAQQWTWYMSSKTLQRWRYGLESAFIGGASGAIEMGLALIIVDPQKFNINEGLSRTLVTTLIFGLISGAKTAFAYLKQSPLPAEDEQPVAPNTETK